MAKPPPAKGYRTNNRGPVEHVAKIPLTAEEHVEIQTLATLDRMSYAEFVRQAIREHVRGRR